MAAISPTNNSTNNSTSTREYAGSVRTAARVANASTRHRPFGPFHGLHGGLVRLLFYHSQNTITNSYKP